MWKCSLCMQSDNKRTLSYYYVRLKKTNQGRNRGNLPVTANYVSSVMCCFTGKLVFWCFGLGFFVRGELFKHVILQYRESYIKVILGFFPCIKFSRKTFVVLTTALY